ncbi:hypothetical protein EMCRGX_G007623 [Ephydatia muelleri]
MQCSLQQPKLPHQASRKEKAKASKPKGRILDFAAPWNESDSQVEASAITSSVVSATNPFKILTSNSSAAPLSIPINVPSPVPVEPTPLPQSSLAQSHQSEPVGVPSPIRRARSFSFSMSPPQGCAHRGAGERWTIDVGERWAIDGGERWTIDMYPKWLKQMEAGIVAAINDLKEALLVKLDTFARPPC